MDEQLQRKISRQLRLLNIMLSLFGLLILTGLIVLGFLLFQVIAIAQNATSQFDSLRDSTGEQLNIRDEICNDQSEFSTYLRQQTQICE